MKKLIPLVVIVIIGIAGLLLFISRNQKPKTSEEETVPANIIEVPIEKRPYVALTPRSDAHEIKFEMANLIEAKSVDYELVYLAGEVSRGVIGSVELKGETSLSRDLLLGSCSKNVCKYDEGITGGTLSLKVKGQAGTQKYEFPWSLSSGSEAKNGLALEDGSFSLTGSFSKNAYYLVAATIGVPKIPEGKIVGGPYGAFTSGNKNVAGVVKIRLNESSPNAKVFGWDSATSSWKEFTKGFETDGQIVGVEVDRLTTFVVVIP